MIYVLLIGLIIQLIYCYYVFDRDIFSPSAIICEVFILSTLACIYNFSGLDTDIKLITAAVILGGNTIFILMSTFIHLFYKKKYGKIGLKKLECLKYINVQKILLFAIVIFYVIFSIVFIRVSMSAINGLGQGGDLSSAMREYRQNIIEDGSVLPGWLTKTGVVFNLGTFVLSYIFINNFLVNRKRKSNYLLLFCVVMYLIASIFTAQRTTILLMFIYILFVTYSLLNRKYQFIKKINFKYIMRGIAAVVVFLLLFGLTRGLFGRQSNFSAVDNVMFYTGNSIEFLDDFIASPKESEQFGEELFRQFRVTLAKFGLVTESTMNSPHLEFRQAERGNFGNVYTAYRYYIHDFGYGSILFFQIVLALFYGIWYEKINRRKLNGKIDLGFIIYAWFMISLFRFSIMSHFFTDLSYFIFTNLLVFVFLKLILSIRLASGREINKYNTIN